MLDVMFIAESMTSLKKRSDSHIRVSSSWKIDSDSQRTVMMHSNHFQGRIIDSDANAQSRICSLWAWFPTGQGIMPRSRGLSRASAAQGAFLQVRIDVIMDLTHILYLAEYMDVRNL